MTVVPALSSTVGRHACPGIRADFDPEWPRLDICFDAATGFHHRHSPGIPVGVATRTPANADLPAVPTEPGGVWLVSAAGVMRAVAHGRALHDDYLRSRVHETVRRSLIVLGSDTHVTHTAGYAYDAWLHLDETDPRRSDYLTQEGIDVVLGASRLRYAALNADEVCRHLVALAEVAERLHARRDRGRGPR